MLILNLKVEDSIFIGEDIEIKLTAIRKQFNGHTLLYEKAVIGVEAPKHIPIVRSELQRSEPSPYLGGIADG